ncbi:hypothetical protein GC194_15015 [bacterium]|nr:hypothetical protein [bacterium]
MKIKIPLLLTLLWCGMGAKAQSLTLSECLSSAVAHMPVLQQEPLLKASLENKLSNYAAQNLPQVNLNGQLTHQSAVPEFPFSLPGIGGLSLPKTQFRTYLEISQPIYTGGTSKALSGIETAGTMQKIEQLNVTAAVIKKQVTEVFFSIAEAQTQRQSIVETIDLLKERQQALDAALKNGVAQQNDVLKLQAELLNLNNQLKLSDQRIAGAKEILSLLCGIEVSNQTLSWETTSDMSGLNDLEQNAELKLINTQKTTLQASVDLYNSQRMPKLFAFAQTGFGQPNPYNFFNRNVSGYYMVGAKLQWSVTDWGKTTREKENITLGLEQLDRVAAQKQLEIMTRIKQLNTDIATLETAIAADEELLNLRSAIAENARHQYDEGIITFSQYLEEVLAEKQVAINKAAHEAQLVKNQNLLQLELGNL